jgi:hypothetical protein
VSVQLCSQCKSPYWRFRGDHPPKGVCSIPCHEERKAGRKPGNAPPLPENALRAMVEHRSIMHGSPDVLPWYECERCDELEAAYSEAIEWHVGRITREIVKEVRV